MSMVAAADILGYEGTETQLVSRMIQNIHPSTKAHLLFVNKPQSVQDMFSLAATVAEAVAVEEQRRVLTANTQEEGASGGAAKTMVVATVSGREIKCWECDGLGHIRRTCPKERGPKVSGNGMGRSGVKDQPRAPTSINPKGQGNFPKGVVRTPWCVLDIKRFRLPAMLDSGSSLSFMRGDVFQKIKKLGIPHVAQQAQELCLTANGESCSVVQAVTVSVKLQRFSWKVKFLVFERCPVPCVLGMDFLGLTRLRLDFGTQRYSFAFRPESEFQLQGLDSCRKSCLAFPCTDEEFGRLVCPCLPEITDNPSKLDSLVKTFPALFSDRLGTAKGMVCHLDLMDSTPVRSRPYQCSPPRLQQLRESVQELLDKGVIRKSHSQYASPAFLVPKPNGGLRMVVDYRLVNEKVVFDAFPMPTVEHAFANFHNAEVFSVLDLNSAYYQIPLPARSRKVTAFCTPFGLFEFTNCRWE
jgi:hypothetical protein